MNKQQVIKWLTQAKEELENGIYYEMDNNNLDKYDTDKEKQAYKDGMYSVITSLLEQI